MEEDGGDLLEECREKYETALREVISRKQQELKQVIEEGRLDRRGNFSFMPSKNKPARTKVEYLLEKHRDQYERTRQKRIRWKKQELHKLIEESRRQERRN